MLEMIFGKTFQMNIAKVKFEEMKEIKIKKQNLNYFIIICVILNQLKSFY